MSAVIPPISTRDLIDKTRKLELPKETNQIVKDCLDRNCESQRYRYVSQLWLNLILRLISFKKHLSAEKSAFTKQRRQDSVRESGRD